MKLKTFFKQLAFFSLLSTSSALFASDLYVWNGQWSQSTAGGVCNTNHHRHVFVPNTVLTSTNAPAKCRNAVDLKNFETFGSRCMPTAAARCAYISGSK